MDIDEMVNGYIETALWADAWPACTCGRDADAARIDEDHASDCAASESGGLNGSHEAHDDDVAKLREMIADWAHGVGPDDLAAFEAAMVDRVGDWTPGEQAGHDLRLTAGGHGAGFWDRGLGELGDRLTAHAKAFGDVSCWEAGEGIVRFDL
jgi:hypothetical protein